MKFLQKNSEFFDLIHQVYLSLQEMTVLFQETAQNFKNAQDYAARAKEIEHEGDTRTHQIIDTLNKLFVTPFDREDIYELAHELDDIIDLIENVIKNVYLYGMKEEFSAFQTFAGLTAEATVELGEMLRCLKTMKYTPEFVQRKIHVHDLEDQGDAVFDSAIQVLLQEETDVLKVIKLKDILEDLEGVMDKYQNISNIIEGILVKSN